MGPLQRIQRSMCRREAARLQRTGEPCSAQWADLLRQEAIQREARLRGLTERTIDNQRKAR